MCAMVSMRRGWNNPSYCGERVDRYIVRVEDGPIDSNPSSLNVLCLDKTSSAMRIPCLLGGLRSFEVHVCLQETISVGRSNDSRRATYPFHFVQTRLPFHRKGSACLKRMRYGNE